MTTKTTIILVLIPIALTVILKIVSIMYYKSEKKIDNDRQQSSNLLMKEIPTYNHYIIIANKTSSENGHQRENGDCLEYLLKNINMKKINIEDNILKTYGEDLNE